MIIPQFPLCLIDEVNIDFLGQRCLLIEGLERLLNILGGVGKVKDIGIGLSGADAVEAGERLHAFHATQLLVNDHGMKQRLVKSRLVFFRDNQHIEIVVKFGFGLILGDMAAVPADVEFRLGIILSAV